MKRMGFWGCWVTMGRVSSLLLLWKRSPIYKSSHHHVSRMSLGAWTESQKYMKSNATVLVAGYIRDPVVWAVMGGMVCCPIFPEGQRHSPPAVRNVGG